MTVRLSMVDLVRRTAVVRVIDDGRQEVPHVLRGTLAALFDEPTWHVVVAFERDHAVRDEVVAVLEQARRWAEEGRCRLSVTASRDLPAVTLGGQETMT